MSIGGGARERASVEGRSEGGRNADAMEGDRQGGGKEGRGRGKVEEVRNHDTEVVVYA